MIEMIEKIEATGLIGMVWMAWMIETSRSSPLRNLLNEAPEAAGNCRNLPEAGTSESPARRSPSSNLPDGPVPSSGCWAIHLGRCRRGSRIAELCASRARPGRVTLVRR
jgi:hypothetical protein